MERPKISETPGLDWYRRTDHWVAYWVCPRAVVKKGYQPKSVRLWPPSSAPHAELTADVVRFLQSECDLHQGHMLAWLGGWTCNTNAYDGTLNGLIRSYETDPDSPFANVRHGTRDNYSRLLADIARYVGRSDVAAIKSRDVKRWFEHWATPATPGGPRRLDKAHGLVTMLRMLLKYGAGLLECPDCDRVHSALGKLSFAKGRPRTQSLTRAQAKAIIAAANGAGWPSIALAQALAFELMLRQRDVIGEWVPTSEPGLSGIIGGGNKWQIGLQWSEVSSDLILTHRLSKSIRGRAGIGDDRVGKVKVYDLKLYPLVIEQLQHIAPEQRSGPMVICESTGLPWQMRWFRKQWRRIANTAGIPADVQYRDSRAGGITEGVEVSGDLDLARIGAGHSNVGMTARYSRADQERTARLAKLRSAAKEQDENK
jgi:hypothetical protein